jgi:hypothetical protein
MSNEKKSRAKAQLMSHLTTSRPGISDITPGLSDMMPVDKSQGLVLSAVQLKDVEFFQLNAINNVFEDLKSADYYEQLKRDIAQDGIVNALIALPDGQLIEGHSRLKVAKELGMLTVPVRFILSTVSPAEVKRRVYLGNLNRFEIPSDMRLILFAEVYPDYFYASPAQLDESHKLLEPGMRPTTAKMVAASMGLSDRQVRNEKEIFLRAKSLAQPQELPSPSLVAKAREQIKAEKSLRKVENAAKVKDVQQDNVSEKNTNSLVKSNDKLDNGSILDDMMDQNNIRSIDNNFGKETENATHNFCANDNTLSLDSMLSKKTIYLKNDADNRVLLSIQPSAWSNPQQLADLLLVLGSWASDHQLSVSSE